MTGIAGREPGTQLGRVRHVIVGLGRIADLLEADPLREKPCTHAGAILANADCALVAGCDINPERCAGFAQRHGLPVYTDLSDMLTAIKPDVLHIATHADSHRKLCEIAVRHGTKLVVCEKPMAANRRDARAMLALQDSGKVRILVNHERRFAADYRLARSHVESGRLGKLLSIHACLYMGEKRMLSDVLWHDGTHMADMIMFLAGGVLEHRKTLGTLRANHGTAWLMGQVHSDASNCHAERQTAIPVCWELGAGRDHLVFELELSFSHGRLRVGNNVFTVEQSEPSPYAKGFRSLGQVARGLGEPTGYFRGMLAEAVACARNPGRMPASSAREAWNVVHYLESVVRWR